VQAFESKILHQHNYQSHHHCYQSYSANNVFHCFFPCSLSPLNFTPQPFGLSQSPSSVVATAASSEAADDNLVVVEGPAVETLVVEWLFLDDEKEIEFLG